MSRHALFIMASLMLSAAAFANPDKSSPDAPYELVATVNGAPISKGLIDLGIQNFINQGQKDSPELRQAVKDDVINKELVAQEASRLGLANAIDFPDHIAQLRQNLLLQAFLDNHFKKNPITDQQLRDEYDRQRKILGDGSGNVQYRVSQIVVANEADAIDLIRRIQKGGLFGKFAQEHSIDQGTRAQGGNLGWVLPSQLIQTVASVLPTMAKGAVSGPISTPAGWVILRLDDKRSFKIPSLEDSKPQLRQAIIQQYLTEVVKGLRANAKISQ